MKKIIYGLLGLIIIAVVVVMVSINPLGKKYAQEFATKLLKTPVSISQFDASILDKDLSVDFIEVQNPAGFQNKNAFVLDHFSVEIGGDVFSDLIEVELLKFDGLEFVLEQGSNGVNLTQLLDNLESQSSTSSSSNSSASDSSASSSNKRIKIKRFLVENIALKVDTSFLKTTLEVPNISASGFGGNAGVSADEIGKQIVKEVLDSLQAALKKKGIEAGKKEIKKALIKKLGDKLGIGSITDKLGLDGITDKLGLGGITDKLGFGSGSSNDSGDTKNLLDTDKLKDQAKDLLKGFGF